jgi:ADP-ribosylglycohydrolase
MATPLQERFVGCLLGGALGDALGYPIEFERSAEALVRAHERGGLALLRVGQGLVSDDTQMSLFSCEALLRARAAGALDPTPFALGAYQRWFTTQQLRPGGAPSPRLGHGLLLSEPHLFARRAPKQTCLAALAASFMRARPVSVSEPPNGSKGCGAVMRAAPFGLAAPSREVAFTTARDAAVLTHGHPSGYLSAAYLAALIYDVSRGAELRGALPYADRLLAREAEHEELAEILSRARDVGPELSSAELVATLGEGWVGEEALAVGLACALAAGETDVQPALLRAVTHPGDSDSTGSIAGNLLGARYGISALPRDLVAELELRELLERVAGDLYVAVRDGAVPDVGAYPPLSGVFVP